VLTGLNHLAFHISDPDLVDTLATQKADHGWILLFPDRHPRAAAPTTTPPTWRTPTDSKSNSSPRCAIGGVLKIDWRQGNRGASVRA
jgi:hypothetical protein